ncbi:MAG TPA: nucleotidyltransferase domain-containing protein [Bacteroidales bacterium]|nr:nucleotidyltransferase domain-containing protein [Bacteroidales bacterium]
MNDKRKYGLKEVDLESFVSILKSNQQIDKAWLFGSRAKGNNDPGSDIDIAIKGPRLNLDDILKAKMKFENLMLPYKLDLVIYDRIQDEDLRSHIDRVGIVLFER